MPVTQQQMRDAGFDGAVGYRDEIALRLLCAFCGVDWQKAPPGWWIHPNESSKAAWQRVAEEAKLIFTTSEMMEPTDDN
jgi:hypothetical protein